MSLIPGGIVAHSGESKMSVEVVGASTPAIPAIIESATVDGRDEPGHDDR
jgi:hypothetical protein